MNEFSRERLTGDIQWICCVLCCCWRTYYNTMELETRVVFVDTLILCQTKWSLFKTLKKSQHVWFARLFTKNPKRIHTWAQLIIYYLCVFCANNRNHNTGSENSFSMPYSGSSSLFSETKLLSGFQARKVFRSMQFNLNVDYFYRKSFSNYFP